ncbi:DgyrCDS5706 [Dimorphilus gyrociliatus]|uniref:DgyrCDS5706 n=1 Tax=Dimorphilus gyrociliatus TaxID=2664684 RepID=A0A7I8VN09_9ANNE|nr:DgyrCDS5706 [Dimorphilus gyrociliatus]
MRSRSESNVSPLARENPSYSAKRAQYARRFSRSPGPKHSLEHRAAIRRATLSSRSVKSVSGYERSPLKSIQSEEEDSDDRQRRISYANRKMNDEDDDDDDDDDESDDEIQRPNTSPFFKVGRQYIPPGLELQEEDNENDSDIENDVDLELLQTSPEGREVKSRILQRTNPIISMSESDSDIEERRAAESKFRIGRGPLSQRDFISNESSITPVISRSDHSHRKSTANSIYSRKSFNARSASISSPSRSLKETLVKSTGISPKSMISAPSRVRQEELEPYERRVPNAFASTNNLRKTRSVSVGARTPPKASVSSRKSDILHTRQRRLSKMSVRSHPLRESMGHVSRRYSPRKEDFAVQDENQPPIYNEKWDERDPSRNKTKEVETNFASNESQSSPESRPVFSEKPKDSSKRLSRVSRKRAEAISEISDDESSPESRPHAAEGLRPGLTGTTNRFIEKDQIEENSSESSDEEYSPAYQPVITEKRRSSKRVSNRLSNKPEELNPKSNDEQYTLSTKSPSKNKRKSIKRAVGRSSNKSEELDSKSSDEEYQPANKSTTNKKKSVKKATNRQSHKPEQIDLKSSDEEYSPTNNYSTSKKRKSMKRASSKLSNKPEQIDSISSGEDNSAVNQRRSMTRSSSRINNKSEEVSSKSHDEESLEDQNQISSKKRKRQRTSSKTSNRAEIHPKDDDEQSSSESQPFASNDRRRSSRKSKGGLSAKPTEIDSDNDDSQPSSEQSPDYAKRKRSSMRTSGSSGTKPIEPSSKRSDNQSEHANIPNRSVSESEPSGTQNIVQRFEVTPAVLQEPLQETEKEVENSITNKHRRINVIEEEESNEGGSPFRPKPNFFSSTQIEDAYGMELNLALSPIIKHTPRRVITEPSPLVDVTPKAKVISSKPMEHDDEENIKKNDKVQKKKQNRDVESEDKEKQNANQENESEDEVKEKETQAKGEEEKEQEKSDEQKKSKKVQRTLQLPLFWPQSKDTDETPTFLNTSSPKNNARSKMFRRTLTGKKLKHRDSVKSPEPKKRKLEKNLSSTSLKNKKRLSGMKQRNKSESLTPEKKTLTRRAPNNGALYTLLPRSQISWICQQHLGVRVPKECLEECADFAEKAYQQLLNDVEDYAQHAGRKKVTVADHFLLFKRLRLINDRVSKLAFCQQRLSKELVHEVLSTDKTKNQK